MSLQALFWKRYFGKNILFRISFYKEIDSKLWLNLKYEIHIYLIFNLHHNIFTYFVLLLSFLLFFIYLSYIIFMGWNCHLVTDVPYADWKITASPYHWFYTEENSSVSTAEENTTT